MIDFFLSETAFHADVVLPGSLHEEDEGTSTNVEGRVIKLNPAKAPPGNARLDWEIICDLAERLGRGKYFPFRSTEEIFEELLQFFFVEGIVRFDGVTADGGGDHVLAETQRGA